MSRKYYRFFLIILSSMLLISSKSLAHKSQDEQQIEVSLRMIGHQILLHSGDSTSRVLPIAKEGGRYRIPFESEFGFRPDELVKTVNGAIKDTKMTSGYIVEIEQCESGEVVYSYQMDNLEKIEIIPCGLRDLPKDCYSLLFTLLDNHDSTEVINNESIESSTKSFFENRQFGYSMMAIVVILMSGMFLLLRKRRRQALINSNLISLGDYQFDKRNTELLFDKKRTELTSKEADLLLLLYDAVNTTIEREVILKRVWGDEGDYVGRTLDVFISKLRKKLEADPKVKIENIRGVGYKLVLNV